MLVYQRVVVFGIGFPTLIGKSHDSERRPPQVPQIPCLFAGSDGHPVSGPHLQPLITVLGKQLEGLCKAPCSKKRGFWIDDAAEGCIKCTIFGR